MALTAAAIEVLTEQPQRLWWCVDLKRDIGPDAEKVIEPGSPWGETPFAKVLMELKQALDSQTWASPCTLGYVIRCELPSTGRVVDLDLWGGYNVDVVRFTRRSPPVGVWRWGPEPRGSDRYTMPGERFRLPDSFYLDGIPF
jgi:hypothetical protein